LHAHLEKERNENPIQARQEMYNNLITPLQTLHDIAKKHSSQAASTPSAPAKKEEVIDSMQDLTSAVTAWLDSAPTDIFQRRHAVITANMTQLFIALNAPNPSVSTVATIIRSNPLNKNVKQDTTTKDGQLYAQACEIFNVGVADRIMAEEKAALRKNTTEPVIAAAATKNPTKKQSPPVRPTSQPEAEITSLMSLQTYIMNLQNEMYDWQKGRKIFGPRAKEALENTGIERISKTMNDVSTALMQLNYKSAAQIIRDNPLREGLPCDIQHKYISEHNSACKILNAQVAATLEAATKYIDEQGKLSSTAAVATPAQNPNQSAGGGQGNPSENARLKFDADTQKDYYLTKIREYEGRDEKTHYEHGKIAAMASKRFLEILQSAETLEELNAGKETFNKALGANYLYKTRQGNGLDFFKLKNTHAEDLVAKVRAHYKATRHAMLPPPCTTPYKDEIEVLQSKTIDAIDRYEEMIKTKATNSSAVPGTTFDYEAKKAAAEACLAYLDAVHSGKVVVEPYNTLRFSLNTKLNTVRITLNNQVRGLSLSVEEKTQLEGIQAAKQPYQKRTGLPGTFFKTHAEVLVQDVEKLHNTICAARYETPK